MQSNYKKLVIFFVINVFLSESKCVHSPPDATGALPITNGKLTWHSYVNYGDGSSQIFIRNISTGVTTQISGGSGWSGITDPMNAVWSVDGKFLIFMAIKNNAWNILTVAASSDQTPTDLTLSTGLTRNEDPKLSADGSRLYWKQTQSGTYRIMSAPISFVGTTPSLGSSTVVKSSTSIEMSMPFPDATNSKIYYSPSSGGVSSVASQALTVGGVVTGSVTTVSTDGYYPIVRYRDNTVFWADNTKGSDDQIVYKTGGTGSTTTPSLDDCDNNNSDMWPATSSGTDYLFFSSTTPGGYQLYLGNLSNGKRWNLSSWYTDSTKAHLGSSYWVASS